MRFREEVERGFHILSNSDLDGRGVDYKKSMYGSSMKPYEAWEVICNSATQDQKRELEAMSNEGKKALVDAVIKTEEERSRRSQKPSEAGKPS